jgi:hypothetical protein
MWAPLHAWRALGELRAVTAVPAMLELLDTLDESHDDWWIEEFPLVLTAVGEPAVEVLETYVRSSSHRDFPRAAVARALKDVALEQPELRDRVVGTLAGVLEGYERESFELNAFLIGHLENLGAIEFADLIERAFEAGAVDEMICGSWDRVAFELGVTDIPPPERPGLLERIFGKSESRSSDPVPTPRSERPRTGGSRTDKAARKRQRRARRKNRRRK